MEGDPQDGCVATRENDSLVEETRRCEWKSKMCASLTQPRGEEMRRAADDRLVSETMFRSRDVQYDDVTP